MKKERIVTILFLAVLIMCTGLSSASAKPMITDISFESLSATADRIIFKLNGPHIPTGKALPGKNPRVYFDFPGAAPANKIKSRIPANGNFVKQIRYAYHKGPKSKTRVVFDLTANQKMDFKQDFNQDTNTLVITMYLAGTEPEPVTIATPPEPDPVVVEKPVQPVEPQQDIGKKVQPMEDISIAVPPEPEQQIQPQAQEPIPAQPEPTIQEAPVEVAMPEPEPEPEPVPEPITMPTPEPEPIAMPEPEPEPEPQTETPQIASIPPSTKVPDSLETPIEEATVIQPMSEVGVQEKEVVEDSSPVLHSIEYDPKSKRGEMISFKMNGFHPPVVFGIEEDIPRIVCFFKNASAGTALRDMIGTNGEFVKNIKVGKYKNPDNIRVVLELVPGYNYDLQQIFFKDDKVFMMIINKAGKKISTQRN